MNDAGFSTRFKSVNHHRPFSLSQLCLIWIELFRKYNFHRNSQPPPSLLFSHVSCLAFLLYPFLPSFTSASLCPSFFPLFIPSALFYPSFLIPSSCLYSFSLPNFFFIVSSLLLLLPSSLTSLCPSFVVPPFFLPSFLSFLLSFFVFLPTLFSSFSPCLLYPSFLRPFLP